MAKKHLITPIVLVVGIVLCSAARAFAISQTNMAIGVLNHNSAVLCNVLFYGLIAATAVLAAVFSDTAKTDGEKGQFRMSGLGSTMVGFGLMAAGIGIGYDALLSMKCPSGSTVFMVISFVFAAAFVALAFIMLYKKEITAGMGFACSFGGVFCVLKGVFYFREHMVVATIPEYLIEALSTVLGGLFFVMAGKLLTGNEGRFTRKMLLAYSSALSALTLSALFGAVVAKLFFSEAISQKIAFTHVQAVQHFQSMQGIDAYMLAFPALANVGLGVLATVMVIAISLNRKSQSALDTKE